MKEKYKSPYVLVLVTWLLIIIAFMVTKSGFIAAFTIFYTGLLPFIYIVLWLSTSETGRHLRDHAKKWHIAIGISWFIFAYAIYAQKWAAETINQIFFVDASNLAITYKLLVFLFAPFGIFYQKSILSGFWNTMIVVAMIWGGIFPTLLILPIPFKRVFKILVVSFLAIGSFSAFLGVTSSLALNKEHLVKKFALWADFNSYHLCSDNWAKTTESVLFLGGDRILAYQPKNPKGSQFSVQTCNYEKKL